MTWSLGSTTKQKQAKANLALLLSDFFYGNIGQAGGVVNYKMCEIRATGFPVGLQGFQTL